MSNRLDLSEVEIQRRLAALDVDIVSQRPHFPEGLVLHEGAPRLAAVLIPFLWCEGGWRLLFTRRNAGLAEHSGQVAFPGGRMDAQDRTPEQTALREAHEEIGLDPADVRTLGRLRQFMTITNYLVTPVVGVMPWPYPLRPSPDEVSRAFTIPLDWLADRSNCEKRMRTLPAPFDSIPVIYYKPYDGEVLWGASAYITLNLLDALQSNGNA